jgi:hypothetical protein
VYASAPPRARQGERTISLDELTGVQATERKHPDLPMQRGACGSRVNASTSGMAPCPERINFDVVTGQVIEPSS